MRKKIYLFPLFLLGFFVFATTSCLNSNNDDEEEIDQEWKTLNETNLAKVKSDNSFTKLISQADNTLAVYWKPSTEITNVDDANTVRVTVEGKPEFTDTVVVRYEGWFFDKDGKKVIFDSTENPSLKSRLDYTYGASSSAEPNYKRAQFSVNGVIGGWITTLQDMKAGEEREVCIPQELAYGKTASTYSPTTSSPSFTLVPAYTTLWFRLKIYKIIPMKGLK